MNKKTFLCMFLALSMAIIFSGAVAAANDNTTNSSTTFNLNQSMASQTVITNNSSSSSTLSNTSKTNNPDPIVVSTGLHFPTIRGAVNNAADGDTIILEPGTYAGVDNSNIELTHDLTIIGSTDSLNPSIIDAGNLDTIFLIDPDITITLEYITFENGFSDAGGAIYNEGNLIIKNCLFNGNHAVNDGGAIYNDGTLTLSSANLNDNIADYGGAIYNDIDGSIIDTGSTFTNNNADYGGAIYNDGALTETKGIFNYNDANNEGGAIYNDEDGTLTEQNGAFDDNNANGDDIETQGGAIYNDGALTESNSNFTGNYASEGGAIYNDEDGALTEKNGIFNDNSADSGGAIYNTNGAALININNKFNSNIASDGGAIYNDNGATLIETKDTFNSNGNNIGGAIYNDGNLNQQNCTFNDNNANDGGAIYNDENGVLKISISKFNGNTAYYQGGAIYNDNELTDYDSSFHNNIINSEDTTSQGGAIYNDYHFNESSSTFTGNNADQGGAIYNTGELTDNGSKFNGNIANDEGGAIYNNAALNESSSFNGNTAYEGGAIYNSNIATLNDDGSYYENNNEEESTSIGGAIYNDGTATENSCTFKSNKAYNGGAIYNNGGLTENSCTFNSSNATNGGAVYNQGDLTDYGSTFSSNTANNNGGAIYNIGYLTDYSSIFNTNNANNNGGAIYNNENSYDYDSTFNYNTANNQGGAIYNDEYGNLNDYYDTFDHNNAYYAGGAIYNIGYLSEYYSTFDTNSANNEETPSLGGAIYNNGNAYVNFNRIVSNTASIGNAIYNDENGWIDATLNWWGTNQPNQTGNDIVNTAGQGQCNYDPWIILSINASPTTIPCSGTSNINADLQHDNHGIYHDPAYGSVPYYNSANLQTTLGSITDATFYNGLASSTLNAGTVPGIADVTTTVDSQTVHAFVNFIIDVTGVNPADGAINVPTNQAIVITFNDPITAGSAYNKITVTYGSTNAYFNKIISGNTLTIWPYTTYLQQNNNWFAGTTYTINLPANALNGLITPFTCSFTTVPPTVTSVNPSNGAINVPTNQVITLTFSDRLQAGSAYNNISLTQGSTKASISKTISGNTLTIKPNSLLFAGTTYTFNIPANAINGLNPFTCSFTTVPPTITSVNPTVGAINVPTSQVITLTFSDPIEAGSAYSSISLTQGSIAASISKTISGNTLTIKPAKGWLPGTTYTINLPSNAVNGLTTPYTSTFKTA